MSIWMPIFRGFVCRGSTASFIFGSLLDKEQGGEFSVTPMGKYTSRQYYIENTNVLCTEFQCERGKFRVIDCAPRFLQYERFFKPLMLVRKVECWKDHRLCACVADRGGIMERLMPETVLGSNHLRFMNFDMQARLTTDVSLRIS